MNLPLNTLTKIPGEWILIVVLITWIVTLLNVFGSERLNANGKLLFTLIVIAFPIVGSLFYYNLERKGF